MPKGLAKRSRKRKSRVAASSSSSSDDHDEIRVEAAAQVPAETNEAAKPAKRKNSKPDNSFRENTGDTAALTQHREGAKIVAISTKRKKTKLDTEDNAAELSKSEKNRHSAGPATLPEPEETETKRRKPDANEASSKISATQTSSLNQPLNSRQHPDQDDSSSMAVPQLTASQSQAHVHEVTEASYPAKDFESWYLRRITAEFAEDLDKIRSASDFHDSSVPILIEALRQGASIFTEEERRVIMGGKE